jgi:hypothetical protein
MRKWVAALAFLTAWMAAPGVTAQNPDPREHNFTFAVDGATIGGVVGYRIGFTRNPTMRTDSRRLDVAYSPDQRVLSITVTEKGLNQLLDWLNSATDAQLPVSHAITIIAKDNAGGLLAHWELSAAMPMTFSSAASGTINSIDSTVEFLFDKLRLVEARAK